jgi:hypothetical protein
MNADKPKGKTKAGSDREIRKGRRQCHPQSGFYRRSSAFIGG